MATDDRGFGDTAVVATVAGVAGDGADLFATATLFTGSLTEDVLARWLICAGWSARLTRAPSRIDLPDAEWAVNVARTMRLDKPAYGHEALAVGRLTFPDPGVVSQVESLVRDLAVL